jgi:lipid A 3-O-deacylase
MIFKSGGNFPAAVTFSGRWEPMKFISAVFLSFFMCGVALGQNITSPGLPSQELTKGTWEIGLLSGFGTGLAAADNTQFVYAGGRVGRVLTRDHFPGWFRGNFEWAVDVLPVYTVVTPARAVYGGSFKPAIWKWNFSRGETYAPYAAIAGGILFSTQNLPPGNTSWVNFSPQASLGTLIFSKSGRALFMEGSYVHHSNARLGTQNPGYNASLFFTVGYDWFRGPKERDR